MHFFQKLAWMLSLLVLGTYYVAFYPSSSYYFNLQQRIVIKSIQLENQTDDYPIRIALWTGNLVGKIKHISDKEKLKQVQGYAAEMNKGLNTICKTIEMDETEVYNFGEDVDLQPEQYCEFFETSNNTDVKNVDAIAFVMYNTAYNLSQLPILNPRKADQIWIAEIRECPSMSSWPDPLENVFNWTMTYRRDSDIWSPYAKIVRRSRSIKVKDLKFGTRVNIDQWISNKTELIFGVISHCNTDSLREDLIEQMNKTGARVDLFGGCGIPTCGRWANCTNFWEVKAQQYKFFMAFENSICREYITEKFWRALELGIVPVGYGGGNFQLEAPPGSYINVRDFSSVEDLMGYLKYLDGNPVAYSKYFHWRSQYKLQKDWNSMHENWCSLCKALKKHKREGGGIWQSRKSYRNLRSWWQHQPHSNKSACIDKPTSFFS